SLALGRPRRIACDPTRALRTSLPRRARTRASRRDGHGELRRPRLSSSSLADREPILGCVSPDGVVIGSLKANLADMRRARVEVAEDGEETGREVLVEEQPHAGGTETNLRSRSAAKARQARMSSRVKSGKSRRISSSLIPDARYSKTSVTVIRRSRTQGFPPRLPGSKVIRTRQSMTQE